MSAGQHTHQAACALASREERFRQQFCVEACASHGRVWAQGTHRSELVAAAPGMSGKVDMPGQVDGQRGDTSTVLPMIEWSRFIMTCSTTPESSKVTNPKPRDLPECGSTITCASHGRGVTVLHPLLPQIDHEGRQTQCKREHARSGLQARAGCAGEGEGMERVGDLGVDNLAVTAEVRLEGVVVTRRREPTHEHLGAALVAHVSAAELPPPARPGATGPRPPYAGPRSWPRRSGP